MYSLYPIKSTIFTRTQYDKKNLFVAEKQSVASKPL